MTEAGRAGNGSPPRWPARHRENEGELLTELGSCRPSVGEPTPVFILGKHRSGTTMLGNILCQHPDIYGVQRQGIHGIRESMYFLLTKDLLRHCDTQTEEGFRCWLELVSSTNFFRSAAVTEADLRGLGPNTFSGLFRRFMSMCASRVGACFWVEKTPAHTLVAEEIIREFPDARFIGVTRELRGWIASSLKHAERETPSRLVTRVLQILRLVLARKLYEHKLLRLRRRHPERILLVTYASLSYGREVAVREICEFLGLDFHVDCLIDKYAPNTSFTCMEEKYRYLARWESWFAGCTYCIARWIPGAALEFGWHCRRRLRKVFNRPIVAVPRWYYADD